MQAGVTVYLEGSVPQLERRIAAQDGGASRPLLAGSDAESPTAMHDKLNALLAKRQHMYRAADCTVCIDGEGMGLAPVQARQSWLGWGGGLALHLAAHPSSPSPNTFLPNIPQVAYQVLHAIDRKIKDSAAERAEKRKFTIKDEGLIPVGSPVQQPAAQREE